jgi:hypothetical protein
MEEAMQKRIRISLSSQTEKKCSELLQQAQTRGDLRMAKRIMAIFAVAEGALYSVTASMLKVHEESIGLWVKKFLLRGVDGLKTKKKSVGDLPS